MALSTYSCRLDVINPVTPAFDRSEPETLLAKDVPVYVKRGSPTEIASQAVV
jgi:hypothetical protein